jgi:hypothetical protein
MSNIDTIQNIKETIEAMSNCYQLAILKLLNEDSNVIISENNNGTFINLTDLDEITINKLENYIEYVNKQQKQLFNIEKEKSDIKKEFFKSEKRNINVKLNKEESNVIIDA